MRRHLLVVPCLLGLVSTGCPTRGSGSGDGPSNDPPVPVDLSVSTDEEVPVEFEVFAEDEDGDDDQVLVFEVAGGPENGTLERIEVEAGDDDDSAGATEAVTSVWFRYTPFDDFFGTDSFTFLVVDGDGDQSDEPGTVTIEVANVNDEPTATAQSVTVAEDESVNITLGGEDVDGDTLSYSVTSQPLNGTLSGAPPDMLYTPDPDFAGNDSFTFVVDDGGATSTAATVDITVTAVNDPPEAFDTSTTTSGPVTIPVSGFDLEGSSLTFAVASQPSVGSVNFFSSTGPDSASITYTPQSEWEGIDTFTFVANDGQADSAPATVTVTVISNPFEVFLTSTFNTDTGQLNGSVHAGWNSVNNTLEVGDFTVAGGATLTVEGTNPFLVDAAGTVTINGTIDLSGEGGEAGLGCDFSGGAGGAGGPGGFDGGSGGKGPGITSQLSGADGDGPGGGAGANTVSSSTAGGGAGGGHAFTGGAGTGSGGTPGGGSYASLPPYIGGSGGGGGSVEDDGTVSSSDGGSGGGGGGGVISIWSTGTLSVSGTIDASGGQGGAVDCGGGGGGGGAGGAIDLQASSMPIVTGILDVSGGFGAGTAGDGADGRTVTQVLSP